MISETVFTRSFTSFWQEMLPLGESLIRKLNREHLKRFEEPLSSVVESGRRGLVNELAYADFRLRHSVSDPTQDQIFKVRESAWRRACNLEMLNENDYPPPNKIEWAEAKLISWRLHYFFLSHEPSSELIVDPLFHGCGILDSCYADVLAGQVLYEVKAGERAFRIYDLRQAITYCALNFQSHQYRVNGVGLVNPRLGVFVKGSLDAFSKELCGMSSSDLCSEIVSFLSARGVSK